MRFATSGETYEFNQGVILFARERILLTDSFTDMKSLASLNFLTPCHSSSMIDEHLKQSPHMARTELVPNFLSSGVRRGRTCLSVFLMVVLISFAFLTGLHSHDDGAFHQNCSLCISLHHSTGIQQARFISQVTFTASWIVSHLEAPLSGRSYFRFIALRAPPA